MPKIDGLWKWNGDEIFDINTAWKNSGRFISNLPSYDTMTSGEAMEILGEVATSKLVMVGASWQNTAAMQGRQLLQIGIHQGFEQLRLAAIGEDLPKVAQITVSSIMQYAEDLIADLALQAFENVMDMISGIPIVGWVVDIVYGLGKTIYDAVTMYDINEAIAEEVALPAVAKYSREADEDLTTELLQSLQRGPTTDWTPYFLPRGRREGAQDVKDYTHYCGYDSHGFVSLEKEERSYYPGETGVPKAWGVEWKHKALPPDGSPEKGYRSEIPAWGGVPGLPKMQWDWQVGQYDILREDESKRSKWPAGDAKTLGHTPYNDTGDFAPSAKQCLFTMWGQVVGNSPQSFQVDPEQLHTRWMDNYLAIRDYINYLALNGGNNATDRHLAYAMTLMNMSAVYNMLDKPMPDNGQGRWPGPHLDFWGSQDDNFDRSRYTVHGDFFAGGYNGGGVQKGLHYALVGDPAAGLQQSQPKLLEEYVMQALEDGFVVPMPTWYGPSWVRPKDKQKYNGDDAKDVRAWRCDHPFAGQQEQAILYWPIVKMMIDNFRDMLHKDFVYKTTVAYVSEDYAAIKGNSALKQKWEDHRKLLLDHSARMTVDLSMIPDHDYRVAMAAAKKKGPGAYAPPPEGGGQPPVPGPGFSPVGAIYSPPPPPNQGERTPQGRRITGGEKVAMAAGLGGALWYLSKVGRTFL